LFVSSDPITWRSPPPTRPAKKTQKRDECHTQVTNQGCHWQLVISLPETPSITNGLPLLFCDSEALSQVLLLYGENGGTTSQ